MSRRQIEQTLLTHPWIARADRDGAVVTASPEALAVRRRSAGPPVLGELVTEHLEHWGEVYDWTYRSGRDAQDPSLDLSGWRATGTGEPLPVEHMAEWADRTVELVMRTRPRNLLELGCGTGMLLHRLHPHLDSYVGTDIAEHVVERLSGLGLPKVRVVRAAAHETSGAAVRAELGERPDCVLLNSVTQCFPSVAYLAAVLHDAIRLVTPGGTVIVGDIRHSGLLEAHCRWLERTADPGVTEPELTARAQRRAASDTELLLDPSTLAAVAASSGRRVRMSLLAKTLTADSELTRYRFDAVLHVEPPDEPEPAVHEWDALGADPQAGLARLAGSRTGPVRVRGIPNRLLAPDARRATTGAELRAALAGHDAVVLVDPDDPALLQVAAPATAASTPLDVLAGPGRPHEPIGAFARTRLVEVARRTLRKAGLPVPAEMTALLPSGPGHDAVTLARDCAAAHRAGMLALGDTGALDEIPTAVARFDEIALHALGRLMAGAFDGPHTAEQVVAGLGTAPRHAWIVRRWVHVLHAEGRAERDPDGRYRFPPVAKRPELDPSGPLLAQACATLGYPPQMTAFFREALTLLPELLADEIPAQALLFPDGDLLTSLSKDQDNVSNTYLNAAFGSVIRQAAGTRTAPLRVIELGAGAGGSTAAALRGLAGADADYLFTDVSRFFTAAAKDRFGDTLRYGLLDINADLVDQGAPRGGADVVLAANVLHCARNVGRSLRWIRDLLAPGGLLIATEAVREHYLVLATMQFLLSPREGTPDLGSGDRRGGTGRVFLTGRQLPAELAEAGLRVLLELPGAESPLAAPAQHLFVAAGI
ncbi:class I SAM-dependent methyltransferase [Planomonospora sp. ID67723]|uniref:class I SAM-dependent methyltransferase n=1 Tax=Planomonospora sp. ID67723 TaxID=2738134 RepID=UPI0018C3ED80|nr:class I SAM-dependent methyltransferase [Planomonospora sp. ID67723]MBG0832722.1 class I SAM-dependent methyltransferase [Planomonospora sp. ID67723]